MPPPKPAFKCGVPGCNRSFQSHDGLKQHTSNTHRVQQQQNSSRQSRNTNNLNAFKCGFPGCNRSFQSHDDLMQHTSNTHRVQQQQNLSRNTNNPFKCGVPGCNHSFQSHDGLMQHTSDTHRVQQQNSSRNANNPFKCGVAGCNHSFQSHDGLMQHTSDTHRVQQQNSSRNTNNPFKCGVPGCNHSFQSHDGLMQHTSDTHRVQQRASSRNTNNLFKSSPVVIQAPTYPIQHQHYYLPAPQRIMPIGNPDSSAISYPDDEKCMHENPIMSYNIQDTEKEPDGPASLLEIDDSLPYIDKSNICNQLVRILNDPDKYRDFLGRRDKEAQSTLNKLQAVIDLPQLDSSHKKQFMRALIKLSRASSLYPECFVMKDVVKTSNTPIAQGSFGVVFQGLLRRHPIAIKEIRLSMQEMENILKDCSTEIIIWRQLHHPNILPFYGVYHLGQRPKTCLLSPWMEHGDIISFLKREPTANRVRLAVDIAEGLEYLHEHEPRIIHCDLKGVNILVTRSRRACLADFGLSKSLRDSGILKYSPSSSIRTAGTLRWTAPELLDDDGENNQETDIFSFGRVCYEIFAGHIPFHDISSDGAVFKAIMEGRPMHRPQGLGDCMWELILSCCKMEPAARPTAREVLEVLCARPDLGPDHRPPSDWNEGFIDQIRSLAERPDLSGASIWE